MGMSSASNGRFDSISWRRTQVRREVSSDVDDMEFPLKSCHPEDRPSRLVGKPYLWTSALDGGETVAQTDGSNSNLECQPFTMTE